MIYMKKKFDVKKLIAGNPKVDKKQLNEARRAMRKLREAGVEPSEYNLAPPFARQIVGEVKNEELG